VGYKININNKNIIFIPDIDKWQKWNNDIVQLVKDNDLLFLDGTFFMNGEIVGKDMSEIPHPFISESMKLFKDLSDNDKSKIHFIHLNHTNSALISSSESRKEIEKKGFHVANEGEKYIFR
jgi:pyrroloquinoline quinone biosynthesis protein B